MIPTEHRITYAEAQHITGRSHGYLIGLVRQGRLSRDGGQRGQSRDTWLSRSECEALPPSGGDFRSARKCTPTTPASRPGPAPRYG